MFQQDELLGHWVHSHEEDTADTLVYRPSSFAFPRSRGRDAFELCADGAATALPVAPGDGAAAAPAAWRLTPDGNVVLTTAGGQPIRQLAVKNIQDSVLTLKR